MPKEHMPVSDEVLMGHLDSLERAGRRDIAAENKNFFENEDGEYPSWTSLKPKITKLEKLSKEEQEKVA